MPVRNSAKALVLHEGKILVNRCTSRFGDYYALPGGGQREGETLLEAVRRELLEEMPPFLTGGEMIESVTREGAVFAEAPHKFEAGTVNAAGAAGLHAAIDYVERVGFDTIHARELAVTADALARMRALPHVRILGSDKAEEHNGILTFVVDNVHPHDVSELLAADGVAVRAGHHCAEPLHRFLGYHATVRASFAFYNDKTDVDRLVGSLSTVRGRMGYDD